MVTISNPYKDQYVNAESNYTALQAQLNNVSALKKALDDKYKQLNAIANPNDPLKLRIADEIARMNPSAIESNYRNTVSQYNIAKNLFDSNKNSFDSYEAAAKKREAIVSPNIKQDLKQKLWYQTTTNQPANQPEPQADRVTLPEGLGTRYSNTVQTLLSDAKTAEDMWDIDTANALKERANTLESFWKPTNIILTTFDELWNTLDNFYSQYSNNMSVTEKDLLGKIKWFKDIIEWQYWPEWEQTKRIESAYGNLRSATTTRLWNAQAQSQWEATKTGTWSIWAWLINNQADQKAQEELANIGINEAKAYDDLYKTYDEFLNNFISQYGNIKNAFTVDTLQKLLAYKTTLATQAQDALRNILNYKYFTPSKSSTWTPSTMDYINALAATNATAEATTTE